MKNKFRMVLFSMATLGLVGCSDKLTDNTGSNEPQDTGSYVYVSAAISLPSSGMRSATDETGETNSDADPDNEIGYDYENDVRSMLLVFANEDNEYITHTVIKGIIQAPEQGSKFDFTVNGEIKQADLAKAYTDGTISGEDVNVYAFCNYTAKLLEKFENEATIGNSDWIDWYGELTENASPAGHTPTISNTIWGKNSFLMSNATSFTTKFPSDITGWDAYADKSNPYKVNKDGTQTGDLTPIKVERAAARIDFRDASTGSDQIYKLEVTDGDNQLNYFDIKLTRMALVNMSNKFYYLRRVSTDGMPDDTQNNFTISGTETKTNFVVDVDAEDKQTEKGITPNNADQHFNFTLFEKSGADATEFSYNREGWYADNITDVLQNKDDTWEGDNQYKIWRYVTENTIPAIMGEDGTKDVSQQKTIQSTGVVFKGAIRPGEDLEKYASEAVTLALKVAIGEGKDKTTEQPIDKETYEYPILYSFNNMLYAGIDELVQAAVDEGDGSPLYYAVDKTLQNWKISYAKGAETVNNGTFTFNGTAVEDQETQALTLNIYYNDILGNDATVIRPNVPNFTGSTVEFKKDVNNDTIDFMKAAPKNGITVYKASNEEDGEGMGYYCYYFYWNRHNDNSKSGRMGPMEFAIVRNNVYKLAVQSISQLGHPRITDFDPDPVDPEDPDEQETNYIQVKVEVLPWVVRVNDIDF